MNGLEIMQAELESSRLDAARERQESPEAAAVRLSLAGYWNDRRRLERRRKKGVAAIMALRRPAA